jgi:purine-binding chemotaxis protein CheW
MSAAADKETNRQSVFGFLVGTSWLGVGTDSVQEVTEHAEATPIPRAPAHIPGLMNLRGAAVPLLDLSVFLELDGGEAVAQEEGAAADLASFGRVLVVQAAEMRVGLLTDRILGVVDHAIDELPAVELAQNRRLVEFALGEFEFRDRVVTVLSIERLLRAARATG